MIILFTDQPGCIRRWLGQPPLCCVTEPLFDGICILYSLRSIGTFLTRCPHPSSTFPQQVPRIGSHVGLCCGIDMIPDSGLMAFESPGLGHPPLNVILNKSSSCDMVSTYLLSLQGYSLDDSFSRSIFRQWYLTQFKKLSVKSFLYLLVKSLGSWNYGYHTNIILKLTRGERFHNSVIRITPASTVDRSAEQGQTKFTLINQWFRGGYSWGDDIMVSTLAEVYAQVSSRKNLLVAHIGNKLSLAFIGRLIHTALSKTEKWKQIRHLVTNIGICMFRDDFRGPVILCKAETQRTFSIIFAWWGVTHTQYGNENAGIISG
jgi:hypothetical protein